MKEILAIILCAGKGTRMNDDSTNKVCFHVAGVPVIKRIVSNFRTAGVNRFVVVVGFKAEKVLECLADEENIVYAFQPVQNGTGGAALCGLNAAKALGYVGPVIISVGDKIISPEKISEIALIQANKGVDAVWGVQKRSLNESGGRIVIRNGKIYGVVEQPDSALLALGGLPRKDAGQYLDRLTKFGLSEKKAFKVIQKAISMDVIPSTIKLSGVDFASEEIEKSIYTNASLYCFDIDEIIKAIRAINKPNAQGEIYLTDALEFFVEKNSVDLLIVDSREQMVTYSTKEDLRELNRFFMYKDLHFASECLESGAFVNYYDLIRSFIDRFGDQKVLVTRAPGRVNLMGRHIDHQGGTTNVMCINRETAMVISPRTDDMVTISNTDPSYKDYSFCITDCMNLSSERQSWLRFIEDKNVIESINANKGEWVNYIKGTILRFQFENNNSLLGMDILVSGNIPRAAGLSSSSSLVVATAEAIVCINHLEYSSSRFVELCGEGEWYVGSRGGAGDHGAMKCCKEGCITHMQFKPLRIGPQVVFSPDYNVIVADSFISSKKSEGSKDVFNQKVAAYSFGFMMIKTFFPQYADRIEYLRDVLQLGLSDVELYELLLVLPERITSNSLHSILPQYSKEIMNIQKNHTIPEYYDIRGVIMYGLAECLRAERAFSAMKTGDYEMIGRLMNISHNGDRVSMSGKPYHFDISDSHIRHLINNLNSGTDIESSRLENQSGSYGCSVNAIDYLVDVANECKGVLGAVISGAGLGGCAVILAKNEFSNAIIETLNDKYYKPNGYKCGAQVFVPSNGSSVIK